MSALGGEPVPGAAGSRLVIFCVYDTVVLDSSEYTIVWPGSSSSECTAPGRSVLLVKYSEQEGTCVLGTRGSKRSLLV